MKHAAKMLMIVVALCSLLYEHAAAEIYKYTDDAGVVHFSNVGVGSAKKYRKVRSETKQEPASRPNASSIPVSAEAKSLSSTNIPSSYVEIINSCCNRHGVDPALVHALVKVESDFNPLALSRKGAMGLMQLMPQTAVNMNVRDTFNPIENIDGGVKYLRYLLDRYDGNLSLALAAYNSGETAVRKWGTIPPFPETQNYVQRVLRIYNNGTGNSFARSRVTIYVGYSEEGALVLTDDISKQKNKNLTRRHNKNL